ncbi:hypothetical protein ACFDTO_07070 [Microbacteriaceae bacterium 4G12]
MPPVLAPAGSVPTSSGHVPRPRRAIRAPAEPSSSLLAPQFSGPAARRGRAAGARSSRPL